MKVTDISRIFDRYMIAFVIASIVAGAVVGWYAPQFSQGLKVFINLTLFLMLFPMMVGIKVDQIFKAAKNMKAISWSVVLNFIVSPMVGLLVVSLALRSHPDFAVALFLLSVTPCAGMVAGWTGFARGNVALALVIVALSLTLSIFTIPPSMFVLAHSLVKIDALAMFKGTILVILVPMIAGDLTRRLIIKVWGEPGFQGIRPILPPMSMLGMFGVIFISMAMGAHRIITGWQSLFIIIPALIAFYLIQIIFSLWLARKTGLVAKDITALVYSVTGKNISLAIALASQFFSPLTVVMLAINPLVQIPAMAILLRLLPRLYKKEKAA